MVNKIEYTKIFDDKNFSPAKIVEFYENPDNFWKDNLANFILNKDNFYELNEIVAKKPILLWQIAQYTKTRIWELFLIWNDLSVKNLSEQSFILVKQPNGSMFIPIKKQD